MRTTLLVLLFSVFLFSHTEGQNCTPSWSGGSSEGIIPDAITNLPPAYEEVPYSTILQFKVPDTSNYPLAGNTYKVAIKDITLTGITGLAAIPYSGTNQFSFSSNPSNGVFTGGSVCCMQIFGTPALGTAGNTYNLSIKLKIHATFGSSPISFDSTVTVYRIIVDVNTGIPSINRNRFDLSQNYPNPVKDKTNISFNVPTRGLAEFHVYNLVGGVLYSKTIDAKAGMNILSYDSKDLEQGVYFYSLTYNGMTLTKRLIIDRK